MTSSTYNDCFNYFKKHDGITFQVLQDVLESKFKDNDASVPDSNNMSTNANK